MNAYTFLDNMMDMYASGSTLRLPPSYMNPPPSDNGDLAYIYDDAVVITVLLKRVPPRTFPGPKLWETPSFMRRSTIPSEMAECATNITPNPFIDSSGTVNIDADATREKQAIPPTWPGQGWL